MSDTEESGPTRKGTKGQAEPFSKEMVVKLRSLLKEEKRYRDLALLCVGVDTCLRASDLLNLRVADVTTKSGAVTLKQRKTGILVQCSLSRHSKSALDLYLTERFGAVEWPHDALLFPGGWRVSGKSLSRRHYSRLIDDWAALLRWAGSPSPQGHIATHSIRRSKTAYIYEQTKDIVACMHLLGHTNLSVTDRYLGVSAKKALEVAAKHPF